MKKQFKIVVQEAKKNLDQVKKSMESVMPELRREIPDQIRTRTRLGGGVDHDGKDRLGGNRKKLAGLSAGYKKTRKRYSSNLSSDTTVSKSNLTATGQLLDAIKAKIVGRKSLEIFLEKNRSVDLYGNSAKINNEQLAEYVEEKRKFFGLTDGEMNKFRRMIREKIESDLLKLK